MSSIIYTTTFYINKNQDIRYELDSYFKCICVFFASVKLFHESNRKVLFINSDLPFLYRRILEDLKVEIIIIQERDIYYANSKELNNDFPGCLFKLDVLQFIDKNKLQFSNIKYIYILDNDILFLNEFHFEMMGVGGLVMDYPEDRIVNGQSIENLQIVSDLMNFDKPVRWFGGEFIGIEWNRLTLVNSLIEEIWNAFVGVKDKLGAKVTEEHIISVLYSNSVLNVTVFNDVIKRVWTTFGYNNVDGQEYKFLLLHFPSEKGKLFNKIFEYISHNTDFFTTIGISNYINMVLKPTRKYHIFKNFYRLTGMLSVVKQSLIHR